MNLPNFIRVEPNVIYETIITTMSRDGKVNAAPMGVIFRRDGTILLRPYMDTLTYRNLKSTGQGVINITRDPEPFVYASMPGLRGELRLENARRVDCMRLAGMEAYIEFRVKEVVEGDGRAEVLCRMLEAYRGESFIQPYTRATYALIEAAIAATRVKVFLGRERRLIELLDEIDRCGRIVVKVASEGRFKTLLEEILREVRRILGHASSTGNP